MEIAHISQEYIQAVKDIKSAILKSRYAAAKQAKTALILLVPSEICTLEVARKVIERCSTGGITPVKIIDCRNAKLMQPCVHRIVFQNARRRIHHSLQSRLIARLVLGAVLGFCPSASASAAPVQYS